MRTVVATLESGPIGADRADRAVPAGPAVGRGGARSSVNACSGYQDH